MQFFVNFASITGLGMNSVREIETTNLKMNVSHLNFQIQQGSVSDFLILVVSTTRKKLFV